MNEIIDSAHYACSMIKQQLSDEPASAQITIRKLNLQPHPEGGYFIETDRDPLLVRNPFTPKTHANDALTSDVETADDSSNNRNIMTSIHYYLSPGSPVGHFHRNKARTVHTLHWGRGRYVVIHADEVKTSGSKSKARIESFVVGRDIEKGEKVQWIVDGGKYKASFLLPDVNSTTVFGSSESETGLLISETVVPGFDFADHDFMTAETMGQLLKEEDARKLSWLLNPAERQKFDQTIL